MNTEELRRLQLTELEILSVVDRICKKNNIKYILYAGSALGAVRHHGFIPWDDDLDIAMTRPDYEKFITVWESQKIEGYTFQDYNTEPNFRYSFGKIRKDNTFYAPKSEINSTMHNGVFLDIFPLDRVPSNKSKRFIQFVYACFFLLYTRGYPLKEGKKLICIITIILLKITTSKSQIKIRDFCKKKLMRYNDKNEKLVDYATIETANKYLENNILDKVVRFDFENSRYPIPDDYDAYLKTQYGNYMQLPPLSERTQKHEGILVFDLQNRKVVANEISD